VAVVRLHEAGAPPPRDARDSEPEPVYTLPVAPHGVPTSLDVVPLPEDRAKLEMQAGLVESRTPVEPRRRYRDALALMQARRYDEALALLAALTREVPSDHPLAAPATYWKGEAHYAARRYREALIAFESVVARFPSSKRVPDALLKAGLCNQRLGQDALAQRYFEMIDHLVVKPLQVRRLLAGYMRFDGAEKSVEHPIV
jgi:TolA-binding protein